VAASLLAVDANETERAGVPFTRTFPIGICCTPTVRATVEIDIVVVANRKHQPGPRSRDAPRTSPAIAAGSSSETVRTSPRKSAS